MHRSILLVALAIMMFIINVDYTAVNLALIPIAHDLHAHLDSIQWILNGYVLSWALFVLPAGKLIDKFKKQHVCFLGLSLFLLASLFAGLAISLNMLIIARVLQGIAGAIYIPTVYALVYLNFDEKERGRAMGWVSLGVGLGMAMGPAIGGFLLSWFDWRSIFFINVPIGLLSLGIIYKYKTRENTVNPTSAQKFPTTLFSNLPFLACVFGILLEQFGFSTIMVGAGLYLQKVLLFNTFSSSIVYLALTVIFGVIATISGSWIDRVGHHLPTCVGLFLMACASLFFTSLSNTSSVWTTCVIFFILGSGMGFAFTGLNTGIVKTVSQEQVGIASSVFIMCALIGNTLGVIGTAFVYEKSSVSFLSETLKNNVSAITQTQLQQLSSYVSNIAHQQDSLNTFTHPLQNRLMEMTLPALSQGIHAVMWMNFIVCILAVCCYGLLNRNIRISLKNRIFFRTLPE